MKNAFAKLGVGFSVLFMLAAFADTAHAALLTPSVPEVDPSSMGAALALLAGSYFVAVSRFRRR
jgi:hypothetical protein